MVTAQELLRLPAVGAEMLASFEAAFVARRSEKDQRGLIRRLLFNSGAAPLHLPVVLLRHETEHFSDERDAKRPSLCLWR